MRKVSYRGYFVTMFLPGHDTDCLKVGPFHKGLGWNALWSRTQNQMNWWNKICFAKYLLCAQCYSRYKETYKETWRVIGEAHSQKFRNLHKLHQKGANYKTCYFQIVFQRISAKGKKKFLSQKHSEIKTPTRDFVDSKKLILKFIKRGKTQ